jgi:hypothetical protein
VNNYHAALDATFPGRRVSMYAGWAMDVISFRNDLGGVFQNVSSGTGWLTNLAAYMEPEF